MSVGTFFVEVGSSLQLYICHLVEYNKPDKNGNTLGAHLRAVQSNTGQEIAALIPPKLCPTGEYIKDMFLELHSARQQGIDGANPISYTELKAYAELKDMQFEPWEVDAIRLCDRVFVSELNKGQE